MIVLLKIDVVVNNKAKAAVSTFCPMEEMNFVFIFIRLNFDT